MKFSDGTIFFSSDTAMLVVREMNSKWYAREHELESMCGDGMHTPLNPLRFVGRNIGTAPILDRLQRHR